MIRKEPMMRPLFLAMTAVLLVGMALPANAQTEEPKKPVEKKAAASPMDAMPDVVGEVRGFADATVTDIRSTVGTAACFGKQKGFRNGAACVRNVVMAWVLLGLGVVESVVVPVALLFPALVLMAIPVGISVATVLSTRLLAPVVKRRPMQAILASALVIVPAFAAVVVAGLGVFAGAVAYSMIPFDGNDPLRNVLARIPLQANWLIFGGLLATWAVASAVLVPIAMAAGFSAVLIGTVIPIDSGRFRE